MITIFFRILRDRKISLIVYCLTGMALLWIFIGMFPIIQEQTTAMMELIEEMPDEFLKAFGVEVDSFTTVEGFLAGKQYSATWPLMVILLLVGLSGSVIAGEIEKGSIEITLSRPISRLRIFFGRYLVGFFSLLIFTIFSVLSIIPLAEIYNINLDASNVFKLFEITFLFGLAILSLSMLLSSVFSEKNKVYMVVGGLILGMYILNTIALIKEDIDYIKYASFFHYLDTAGALIFNTIGTTSVIVFICCTIVFTFLGCQIFNKRDIAI